MYIYSTIGEDDRLQVSPELLMKAVIKSRYFVPRTCYIIAVMKVAFIFEARLISSLTHVTGGNLSNKKTAHITLWILETLTAYILVTIDFRNVVL